MSTKAIKKELTPLAKLMRQEFPNEKFRSKIIKYAGKKLLKQGYDATECGYEANADKDVATFNIEKVILTGMALLRPKNNAKVKCERSGDEPNPVVARVVNLQDKMPIRVDEEGGVDIVDLGARRAGGI